MSYISVIKMHQKRKRCASFVLSSGQKPGHEASRLDLHMRGMKAEDRTCNEEKINVLYQEYIRLSSFSPSRLDNRVELLRYPGYLKKNLDHPATGLYEGLQMHAHAALGASPSPFASLRVKETRPRTTELTSKEE